MEGFGIAFSRVQLQSSSVLERKVEVDMGSNNYALLQEELN